MVRLVTDSAADLDAEIVAAHGIGVVPLDVRLGEIGPEVTASWSSEEFWRRSATSRELPETSAPSPGAFAAAFSELAARGTRGIVCVTLSSKLSATYQAAVVGAREVAGDVEVRVVDSRLATMAEGLVVLDALAVAERGGDLAAVERAALRSVGLMGICGALASLDNLRKSGRLGAGQALLGGLLDIRPVLQLRDGGLGLESRPRTRSRSLERLRTLTASEGELERIAVVHAAADDVEGFVSSLSELCPRENISVGWLGPVIGAHVGLGTIAIASKRRAAD